MSTAPPLLPPSQKDAEHLQLLVIFHFVIAGMALFGVAIMLLQFRMMDTFFTDPEIWKSNGHSNPPPASFFAMFRWFATIFGCYALLSLLLNVSSGICLVLRKYRVFSLVVAGINCLYVPFGTALGVMTIIVLTRESVQSIYRRSLDPNTVG